MKGRHLIVEVRLDTNLRSVHAGDQKVLSRFFAPFLGIDEDPVTGSANSVLVPYWRKQLEKDSFDAEQCSLRGGHLRAEHVTEPSAPDSVRLTADAVIIIQGHLFPRGRPSSSQQLTGLAHFIKVQRGLQKSRAADPVRSSQSASQEYSLVMPPV